MAVSTGNSGSRSLRGYLRKEGLIASCGRVIRVSRGNSHSGKIEILTRLSASEPWRGRLAANKVTFDTHAAQFLIRDVQVIPSHVVQRSQSHALYH